jgi:hypothetical protein
LRFDGKLKQTTDTIVVLGLWVEEKTFGNDETLAEALTCGLARLVTFPGVR